MASVPRVPRVPSPPSQSRPFTFTPRLEVHSGSQSEGALAAEMVESYLPQDATLRSLHRTDRIDSRHLGRLPRADARMLIISQNGPLQSSSPSSLSSLSSPYSPSPSSPPSVLFCFHNLRFSLHRRFHFVLSLYFPLSEAAASCFPVGIDRLCSKVASL